MSTAILRYTGCDCCSCVAPRLLSRTRSAGGSKRGFRPLVYSGGLGVHYGPFYLAFSQTGSIVCFTPAYPDGLPAGEVVMCPGDYTRTDTIGGYLSADIDTGDVTGALTGSLTQTYSHPCAEVSDSYDTWTFTASESSESVSSIIVDTSGINIYDAPPDCTGSFIATFSSEFTDAMLFLRHPVPAFDETDEFAETLPYGLFVFNGVTLARAESEYKFSFPVPGNGICYRIKWYVVTEALTPAGLRDYAVEHTYEALSFTWDGDVPEDYDVEDSTTWPTSPTYTIPVPDYNASVKVVVIGATVLEDPEAVVTGGITYSCERCA
jgi:hypothetical protein